ncbi:hypothetical protein ACLBWP_03405 [Microbacterium sp. M1A1_1b]
MTPEQYRVLADDVQHTVDNGYEFAPERVVAALRAAADQLQAIGNARTEDMPLSGGRSVDYDPAAVDAALLGTPNPFEPASRLRPAFIRFDDGTQLIGTLTDITSTADQVTATFHPTPTALAGEGA